jgi:HTH-like domain
VPLSAGDAQRVLCVARPPRIGACETDRQLKVPVRASSEGSKQRYGSPRIHRDLLEHGEAVSRKRVIRLMQEEELQARVRKRFKCTTNSDHGPAGRRQSPRPRLHGGSAEPAVARWRRVARARRSRQ